MNTEIENLIKRGVSDFVDPENIFLKKLNESPKNIIIKFGVDPTRPDIHLGHAVVLRKLRKFQDLGCKVVFLVGDYTAKIGDPTGKSKVRPEIDQKEIEKNMKTYLDQVGKILKTDKDVFSWIRNSDWFVSPNDLEPKQGILVRILNRGINPRSVVGKAILFNETRMQKTALKREEIVTITLTSFLSNLRKITHSRLIERDMFQKRLQNKEELFMHEMMYPVLQGVDSHVISKIYGSCDLEIGGTDQTFNMLLGRDVMKNTGQKQQSVLSVNVLVGTDGKEKMSKSLDNYIAITDEPNDMYGKVMSIPDTAIFDYFELCTFTPLSHIEEMKNKMDSGSVNPRDLKMELARQIVTEYHGEKKAKEAEDDFVKKFQKGEIPENIETIEIEKDSDPREVFVSKGIAKSKSELKRLFDGGGVTNIETKEKVPSPEEIKNGTYKFGSKSFYKINKK